MQNEKWSCACLMSSERYFGLGGADVLYKVELNDLVVASAVIVVGAVVDDVARAEVQLRQFVHSVRLVFFHILQTVEVVQRLAGHVVRQVELFTQLLTNNGLRVSNKTVPIITARALLSLSLIHI